jgi:uncharacterized membrane protein YccC
MDLVKLVRPDSESWKAGLRTAAAGGVALLLAQMLDLPQGYWAVISAVIIVQNRIGASLQAAASRIIGTVVGGFVGFAFALITPADGSGAFLGLMLALILLGMLAARNDSLHVAPLTAAILLVSTPSHADVWTSATHRMMEIMIGSGIGVLVSMTVAPGRSDTWLRTEAATILNGLATLVGFAPILTKSDAHEDEIARLNGEINGAFRSFSTLATEIAKERASHISHGTFDPHTLGHLLRALRRMRRRSHITAIFPSR